MMLEVLAPRDPSHPVLTELQGGPEIPHEQALVARGVGHPWHCQVAYRRTSWRGAPPAPGDAARNH